MGRRLASFERWPLAETTRRNDAPTRRSRTGPAGTGSGARRSARTPNRPRHRLWHRHSLRRVVRLLGPLLTNSAGAVDAGRDCRELGSVVAMQAGVAGLEGPDDIEQMHALAERLAHPF